MKILTSAQMREVDRLSTEKYGIPSLILMENAGAQVFTALKNNYPDLSSHEVAIFCGKGNNGGDGFVVARQLVKDGIFPDVYLFAHKQEVKADARVNLETLDHMQVPIIKVTELKQWQEIVRGLNRYHVLVDGLLGTGITKPVSGLYEAVIKAVNEIENLTVVSIDIPSGISADSEDLIGEAIRADITVTFTAPKIAHVLGEASQYIGELIVAPIGSPKELLESDQYYLNLITTAAVARQIPKRRFDSHKGTYGHILVVSGSKGKSGAAAMTGMAALRMGAGLVTVATAKSAQSVLASHGVELMTEGLEETEQGTVSERALDRALALLENKDVLAIGPGLTTHPSTVRFVQELVRKSPVPVALDADGINAFAGHAELLRNESDRPITITPHPGEMARLLNTSVSDVQAHRMGAARDFAIKNRLRVVLKGYRTLVADPKGQIYVNFTGNPGMATGGSGDVLTGMIASLLVSRGADTSSSKDYTAAVSAAVYLHGLAGDLAARCLGEESLIASDLLKFLPEAICDIQGETTKKPSRHG